MFDAQFYQNPYQTYRQLRTDGQMIFSDAYGVSGTWLVPRYDGVTTVLNDPGMKAARTHRFFDKFSDDVKVELARFAAVFKQWIIFMDPPDHDIWRKVAVAGFAATHVKGIREEIESIAAGLLDDLEDRGEFVSVKTSRPYFPRVLSP